MLLESMHRSEEEKQLIELLEKTEFGTSYESHLSKVFGHDATRRDWADEYYRHDTRDKPPAKGLRELLHLLQSLRFQFEFAKIKTIYEKYHRVDGVVLRLAHRLDAGPTIRSRFVPPDHWNMPEIHVSSFTEPTGDGKAFKVSIELSTDPAAAAKLIDIHQSPSTFVGPCALLLKRHGHEKQHVLIVWADRQDSFSCHLKLEKVEPGAVTTIVLAPGTLFRPPPPPSSYPTFSVGEDTRGPRLKVADPDGALEEKERKTNPNDPARVSFVEDKIEVEMP
jgi:hypothetical protein